MSKSSPSGFQIIADCEHSLAGVAGIWNRTLFQKREFHEAAPREPSGHLMGALWRIRCCNPGGRCLYPSRPMSPISIRITLISLWTSARCSPSCKMIRSSCCCFSFHFYKLNFIISCQVMTGADCGPKPQVNCSPANFYVYYVYVLKWAIVGEWTIEI